MRMLAPVKIFYDAHQPVAFQFGSVAGTTFGKEVFLNAPAARYGDSGSFTSVTRLLLHELQHVVQYKNVGWHVPTFGLSYLFGYCKNGFKYESIPAEVDARNWAVSGPSQHITTTPLTDSHRTAWIRYSTGRAQGATFSKSGA